MEIMQQWDNRASRAFAALAWMLATSTGKISSSSLVYSFSPSPLATNDQRLTLCSRTTANITANSIAAANDFVTLCPQFVNLTRGQVLAAVLGGWACVPWQVS
jgi:NCS1 family nucleobase:cation symporter-1